MDKEIYEQRREDDSLKLFVVLSKASRTLLDLAETDMERYGLNPTEFATLELLYHRGPQPLQKIGDRILLTSGSITYVVNSLEKKGYLDRVRSEDDRRVTYAQITDKGQALLGDIFPEHWLEIQRIVSGLSGEEKQQAIKLLKKLGVHAEKLRDS
ncbi:MarR family winged helix-turn-helix transcriptional regulator [Tenuibacillus multivorans]|uniref:MarR family transcriptional regulator, 2-MHQ and catechol-resistance regulon repressor n=1 Tax=Tenuibacillus multivorans TaxID=237069 RepID=A0A1H0B9C0_9BACI|nr:MarR family transcriptional regulator [Tenuibacillus multivorans]GEL78593.1 HTH-type transcriptional regulator MhqR [Tenuibacillus multivorans]SDN42237.1 MarR family transcriptional regulator, 2-MHQ and catechol-resistance regulon repressor [Tenuibacillus multivorans]